MRNDFTRSLLNYSAERDDCIGRPDRWGSPPPLVVGTQLHEDLAALADEIWADSNSIIWYFLIGGPGNGKSEAVGAFVSRLNSIANSAGKPPVFESAQGKHGGSIPYSFTSSLSNGGGIELIQDVSVPKTKGSRPEEDLLGELDAAASLGMNVVCCANRGMLLRATRLARTEPGNQWLVPILENLDLRSQEAARSEDAKWKIERNGREIEIRVWPLDHESVLFGQGSANPWAEPEGSLIDKIIIHATTNDRWEKHGCDQCPARELCPLFGDAQWLRDKNRRLALLRILRYAEVWSGQRIVLREALGFISLALVGCPSDFIEDGQQVHPCDWVQNRIAGKPAKPKDDLALLELLSHRIYQDLFGRPSPTGLSIDGQSQERDRWIEHRLETIEGLGKTVMKSVCEIDRSFAKQSGPLRLVGIDGILPPLDPARDPVWCSKHEISIDGQISQLRTMQDKHQGPLERELGDLFQSLEDAIKLIAPHNDPAKAFAALYRWSSTIYLRLSGTALGELPNAEIMSNYLQLLQKPLNPIQAVGTQTTLRDLMKGAADNVHRTNIAPSFFTELPNFQLKPAGARPRSSNPRWPANDRLILKVVADQSDDLSVVLTATTFMDAWRKQLLGVAEWNISPAMENLMRAWRDDFIVAKGRFRNFQTVEFNGEQPLEFEFISPTEIQVRIQ